MQLLLILRKKQFLLSGDVDEVMEPSIPAGF